MSSRFVIEGEWTGYTSAQRRVVHRTVHAGTEKRLREWVDKTRAIRYSDGTSLVLSVRNCGPRERITEIRGYSTLIANCVRHNVATVDDLP